MKPIKGHERYMVDEHGNIFDTRHNLRKISQSSDNQGYKTCTLETNGKHKTHRVHRLVARAYIENPLNMPQVNHIDGNKSNNDISNLEWCNNSWNTICGYNNNAYIFKRNSMVIDVYSPLAIHCIGRYRSMRHMCDELGLNRKTLRTIFLGMKKNIYDYRFIIHGKGPQTTQYEVAIM